MKSWDFHKRVSRYQLPIYVERVGIGRHPMRDFHTHDSMEIVLITAGQATYIFNGRSAPITSGDLLVVQPGNSHAYDHTETLALVNLVYNPDEIPMPLLDAETLPFFRNLFPVPGVAKMTPEQMLHPVIHLSPEETQTLSDDFDNLQNQLHATDGAAAFLSLALFMALVVRIARYFPAERRDSFRNFTIGGALDRLKTDTDHCHPVDELASRCGMSRSNFFRRFEQEVGSAPSQYQRLLRLQKAQNLLDDPHKTITSIALECGFCDGAHLARLFRKQFGLSPKQYRKNIMELPLKT